MTYLTFAVFLDITCFIYSFIQQILSKCQLCASSGVTVRKKMDKILLCGASILRRDTVAVGVPLTLTASFEKARSKYCCCG